MPVTWQDSTGRTWSINLTLELADQILSVTQVDLLPDDNDYREFVALCIRPRKLSAVLWECSRKAADATGVTKEAFGEGLNSDALAAGWQALKGSIENFSTGQNPKLALIVKETLDAQMRGIEAGVTAVIEVIKSDSMDETLREVVTTIDSELKRNLKDQMRSSVRKALETSATNSLA
jgi:hypothetical protein